MVEVPRDTPGSKLGELRFVAPQATPHAGQGVNASGAHAAVNEMRNAYAQLGQTIGRSGEELERTAEFIQTMRNNVAAQDSSFNYFSGEKGVDNNLETFQKLEGKDATNALPKFFDQTRQQREDTINAAPNLQQRELISRDITPRTNLILTQAARHAAQQEKAYNDKIAANRVGSFQGAVAAAPEDDNVFNESVDSTAGAVVSKLSQQGMLHPNQELMGALQDTGGMGGKNEKVSASNAMLASLPADERGHTVDNIRRAVAGLWQTRFNKLIDQGKAWKAKELYDLNKDRQDFMGIHEDSKVDFEKKIDGAMAHQGASMVTEGAMNGTPLQVQGADFSKIQFHPDVDNAIRGAMQEVEKEVGHPLHISFDEARKIAAVESSGNPESNRNKATQYKGLYQMGTNPGGEWEKHGRGEDVFDAQANARGFFRKVEKESEEFKAKMGNEPTFFDHYMMHQRGVAGHIGALRNPDQPEWQVMQNAEPGRSESWAKDTVTKNGGQVDDTARQFNARWAQKLGSQAKVIGTALPKLDADNLDKGNNTLDKRLQEADRLSEQLAPGNTVLRDNARKAVESAWNRVKRQFDSQINATHDNLTQSMLKANTDWDTFIKDSSNKALYDELQTRSPDTARKFFEEFHSYSNALASPAKKATPEQMNYFAKISGMAGTDRGALAKMDLTKEPGWKDFPPTMQGQMLTMQRSAQQEGNKQLEQVSTRVGRNTDMALRAIYGDPHSGTADERKDIADKWNTFHGYMGQLITQMEKESGKPLEDAEIQRIAGRLLRQQTMHNQPMQKFLGIPLPWTGGDVKGPLKFEKSRQDYIDAYRLKSGGRDPSEEEINDGLTQMHVGARKEDAYP